MGRKQSTVGGYAHSCYQILAYVFRNEEETQPSQNQLYKLRAQSLKGAAKDKKWEKRSEHWLPWSEAQIARMKAEDAWKKYRAHDAASHKVKAKLLRRAILIGLMTVSDGVCVCVCVERAYSTFRLAFRVRVLVTCIQPYYGKPVSLYL